jgi:hypothetical protein
MGWNYRISKGDGRWANDASMCCNVTGKPPQLLHYTHCIEVTGLECEHATASYVQCIMNIIGLEGGA